MLFKNRAVQIKMVNTKNETNDSPIVDIPTVDPEVIAKIATDFTVKTVGAIGVAFAANRVLNTICEIAVIAAKAKLK